MHGPTHIKNDLDCCTTEKNDTCRDDCC